MRENATKRLIRLCVLAMIVVLPARAETDDDTVVRPRKPRFQIVDGDTVKFGPQLVRLFGIDAPEKSQTCDDGQWHPGPLAKKALEDFIAGRLVTCKQVDHDATTVPWRSASRGRMTCRHGWSRRVGPGPSDGSANGTRLRNGRLSLAS